MMWVLVICGIFLPVFHILFKDLKKVANFCLYLMMVTFLKIQHFFNCIPRQILAKNFGVSESAFSELPTDVDHTRYIFQGEIPGPLSSDKVPNKLGERSFSYHISDLKLIKTSGGTVRIIDSTIFPAASTIAVGIVDVEPGGLRRTALASKH
jgi:oxalate decarboxylase